MASGFGTEPLAHFSSLISERSPAPGGGSVCAIVTAFSAGLVEMAARFAPEDRAGRAAVILRADELRAACIDLADQDATVYGAVLAARRSTGPERSVLVDLALREAANVPFEIASCAAEVAELARALLGGANPNLIGDTRAALELSAACAVAAVELVVIDLAGGRDNELLARALDTAARARAAREGR